MGSIDASLDAALRRATRKELKEQRAQFFRTLTVREASCTMNCCEQRGRLAQLVRAPALQAGGRRFEPCTAHHPRSFRRALASLPQWEFPDAALRQREAATRRSDTWVWGRSSAG
jgi:hypothetical protein